ncbi:hypothetical protein HZA97_01080 [Candidatus Woesearchaeota archaeon]|nr:hypothetical protein [Candidatus Woesearchaeota archaeon]
MNNQILGEKKKSNFDENLADYVNELAEKGELKAGNQIEIPSGKKVIFYKDFAYKHESRNLDSWLQNWPCKISHMPSMQELYLAGKQNKDIPENLRILTRTSLVKIRSGREFEVVHNQGSLICENQIVFVPYFVGEDLENQLRGNVLCGAFLRTLFNTEDSPEQILNTLRNLSKGKKIILATPEDSKQKEFITVFYSTADYCLLTAKELPDNAFQTIGVKYE